MSDSAVQAARPTVQKLPLDLAGYAAISLVVLIWAGFALSIRAMGSSPLATADVALIRFGIPSLALCLFLPSRWPSMRLIRPSDGLMILAGAGLPFFWLAAMGGAESSAAHVGALIAGTAPLSVALLSRLFGGPPSGWRRLAGLAVIAVGAFALVAGKAPGGNGNIVLGAALLLGASLLWGTYTLALRRTALDTIGCALLLAIPSFVVLLLLIVCGVVPANLGHFSLGDAMPYILVQGLGSGIAASLAYAFAITRLGASRSAQIGSLAPVLTSLAAVPLLGETLTPLLALGVVAITTGVILANRS